MSNFEPNAILRGAQLTIVGTTRALRNPKLSKYKYFRQAALAACIWLLISALVQIPIIASRIFIWVLSLLYDIDRASWSATTLEGMHFVSHFVLQVPFLLMALMRYITPTMDEIFMESLQWVDSTYIQKHRSDDSKDLRSMYYPNLSAYSTNPSPSEPSEPSEPFSVSALAFMRRSSQRASIWLAVYLVSLLPRVGRFVIPATSFYTFREAVGTAPASVIFGLGLMLPKWVLVLFLHSYFASRSVMRELLTPYFRRIRFTKEQKRRWFRDREGVLFGFGLGFTIIIRMSLVGFFVYGIAQASTAYLITKITDPPPPPTSSKGWTETQVTWKNKHDFLRLPLDNLDKYNIGAIEQSRAGHGEGTLFENPGKKYT